MSCHLMRIEVAVLLDGKSFGDSLYNNVNVVNTNRPLLKNGSCGKSCYAYFSTIFLKKNNSVSITFKEV